MTFKIKEHKGLVVLVVLVLLFFAVKYDYVTKDDVRNGFHAAVDLTEQIGKFAADIWTGHHAADQARKQRADERLNKHLDSVLSKEKK